LNSVLEHFAFAFPTTFHLKWFFD